MLSFYRPGTLIYWPVCLCKCSCQYGLASSTKFYASSGQEFYHLCISHIALKNVKYLEDALLTCLEWIMNINTPQIWPSVSENDMRELRGLGTYLMAMYMWGVIVMALEMI